MLMGWIWCIFLGISILFSSINGQIGTLSASILQGAQEGIQISISIAGSLCLWSGVGKLLEHSGIANGLCRILNPILHRLFPESRQNAGLAGTLSANICANILGLGNAATPMGVQAAKAMKQGDVATDELCRLVVLNTASIQLLPTNVAAVRSGLGCGSPFDILPAVWVTSLCSAGLGIAAAWLFGKLWKHD